MRLTAKRPCSFGGRRFYIGEEIPDRLVLDTSAQEKMGAIMIAAEKNVSEAVSAVEKLRTEQTSFSVPIRRKNDSMTLHINEEQLCRAVEVMQMSVGEAKEAVRDIEYEPVLILLHACDGRRAVKEAVKAAAARLFDKQNKGEARGKAQVRENERNIQL